jgi:hypothetical protein
VVTALEKRDNLAGNINKAVRGLQSLHVTDTNWIFKSTITLDWNGILT